MTPGRVFFAAAATIWITVAPAWAGDPAIARAETAVAELLSAIVTLQSADSSKDRVVALTRTLASYEAGLAALRDAERRLATAERAIIDDLDSKRSRNGRILAALAALERTPVPLLLLHPDGALGTARSGMVLATVTPALEAEVDALRRTLADLRALRDAQETAGATLRQGMIAAQTARAALGKAIQDRAPLPRKFIESPEELAALQASAASLDAFATGLAATDSGIDTSAEAFSDAKGTLPLPVRGRLLRKPDEPDAAGIRRPGLIIATEPMALVTAPVAGTVRYSGSLLDYGLVMILEPQAGYLLVLAGLGTLYGTAGDVIDRGVPIGLMGGTPPGSQEIAAELQEGSGAERAETLYMELRQGKVPVDPLEWFILTGED